jgi:hypothetical protein
MLKKTDPTDSQKMLERCDDSRYCYELNNSQTNIMKVISQYPDSELIDLDYMNMNEGRKSDEFHKLFLHS